MTREELLFDIRARIMSAILVGPVREVEPRLIKILDEFEKSYLELLERSQAIENLDESPHFEDDHAM